MKTLFLLLITLFIFSCRDASESKEEKRIADSLAMEEKDDADGMNDDINTDSPDANAFVEFGTTRGDVSLRLRDWKSKSNLMRLGTPLDTLSRVLTLGSDTHQGSTVEEYKYEDINLEFFKPKGSNDSWLRAVEIKGGDWATARGIKIGDSLDDVKSMYPKVVPYDENKELYTYHYTLDESVLLFKIDNDKVSRIKIEYNIP